MKTVTESTPAQANTAETTAEFSTLMDAIRNGSQDAAWKLVQHYGPYVFRVIRRNLRRDIRSKFDSQDFAQAVWTSFFNGSDRLTQMDRPEQLIRYLGTMARNKVVDEGRRRMTIKYRVEKERSMDRQNDDRDNLASREPTPSQFAIAREQWEQMLSEQTDDVRRMIELKVAGKTHRSIAAELRISEKTVQRAISRLSEAHNQ